MNKPSIKAIAEDLINSGFKLSSVIKEVKQFTYTFTKRDREVSLLEANKSLVSDQVDSVCLGVFYTRNNDKGEKILGRPLSDGPAILTWDSAGNTVDEIFSGLAMTAPRGKLKSQAALQVIEVCCKSIPEVLVIPSIKNKVSTILCSLNNNNSVLDITGAVWPKTEEDARDLIRQRKVRINNEVVTDTECWMSEPSTYWLHVEDLFLILVRGAGEK